MDSSPTIWLSVAYDMTGERVSLQALTAPPPIVGYAYFSVNNSASDVFWRMSSDEFSCRYNVPMVGMDQILWQGTPPPLPAWVGLRESDGGISCEILEGSPPSWTWKSYGTVPPGTVDPKRVDVQIGAYHEANDAGSFVVSYDNYNLPPVP